MENACFGVFELHIQVAITYQGKIRLIFSLIVWFLVCFRPFSRLVAWLCVCVWGGHAVEEREGGAVRLFSVLTFTSRPILVPRCVFCVHVCVGWGSLCMRWGARGEGDSSFLVDCVQCHALTKPPRNIGGSPRTYGTGK